MIEGPSGSGKSSLAMELLGLGARLVADDATLLWRGRHGVQIWAGAPDRLPARIESRGLGLCAVRLFGPVPLWAVLSLVAEEAARLPQARRVMILGRNVALFHRPPGGPLAPALFQHVASMGSESAWHPA